MEDFTVKPLPNGDFETTYDSGSVQVLKDLVPLRKRPPDHIVPEDDLDDYPNTRKELKRVADMSFTYISLLGPEAFKLSAANVTEINYVRVAMMLRCLSAFRSKIEGYDIALQKVFDLATADGKNPKDDLLFGMV